MKSGFALIDIKAGRKGIEKRLRRGEKVTVNLTATLDPDPRGWSDDGISTEFSALVTSIKEVPNQ